jgi:UPF0755 protein
LFVAAVVGAAWICAAFAYYALSEMKVPALPAQFSIKKGSSLKSAASQMAAAGVLQRPELFVLMGRLMGKATSLKAGFYELDRPVAPLDLLRKITQGDYTLVSITLVEGWTFRQVRKALAGEPGIQQEIRELSDADVAQRLAIEQSSPEGWFFPDTYNFSHGTSDLRILRRAHELMKSHLTAQWERRAQNLPLASPYEALILASIIEKETGKPDERPLIAAVFVNRLRLGMRLQTDPTVIYGIGESFDGNLRSRDLTTDTPYNTYTRSGLPPTPIALAGGPSLEAAVSPEITDALYFVATGRPDGSHYFSATLEEHDRAVRDYLRCATCNDP